MSTSLTRRTVLTRGSAGLAVAAGSAVTVIEATATTDPAVAATTGTAAAAATSCGTESTEQEEGPFYVAEGLVRSDITGGEDGIPLSLTITVLDPDTCAATSGVAVDIWHANAAGEYSDETSEGTSGETYLRGLQVTDSHGQVHFTSIAPGWYAGRTIHIHERIYSGGTVSGSSYSYGDATLLYTGQFFFSDDVDATIASTAPYSSNGTTRTTNSQDRVYTGQNGSDHVLTPSGSAAAGFTASVTLYVAGDGSSVSGADDEDDSEITLHVSDSHLSFGEKLTLHGILTDTTSDTAIAGATVLVAQTFDGTTRSATVRTGDDGTWTLTHPARHTAAYRATFAGDEEHLACSSAKKTVPVHYRVGVADVVSARTGIELAGTIRPARQGRAVTVSRISSDGARHRVAHTVTDRRGRWAVDWDAASGSHRLLVTVAGDDHLRTGRSRTLTVRRR